jgi:hypothetical protein
MKEAEMPDERTQTTGEVETSGSVASHPAGQGAAKASDPRWRDLLRRAGDVAVKKAERDYAGRAYVSRRELVVININTVDATAPAFRFPLSCSMSCETMAQGPLEEHGHRSHADGLWHLAAALDCTKVTIRVRVQCVRTNPVRFSAEQVVLAEAT